MSNKGGTAADPGRLGCEQCDKRFTRAENLARHMKTHDSVRKHRCTVCGRQFTRSDLRKKHESLHERTADAGAVSKTRRKSRSISTSKEAPSSNVLGDTANTSYLEDHAVIVPIGGDIINVIPQAQSQSASLDENYMRGPWPDQVQFNPYFDYATFARPWNYPLDNSAEMSDWFSSQFIAALRETDLAYSPPVQTWSAANYDSTNTDGFSILEHHSAMPSANHVLSEGSVSRPSCDDTGPTIEGNPTGNAGTDIRSDQLSRSTSPPNESSHEDRLPFAWDPRSRPIVRAKPIILAADDPIFASIDQSVRIDPTSFSRFQYFLKPRNQATDDDTFVLPGLPLVNVFISLFFNRFLPQAPVLHRPTLNIATLPPALLAIIMVIGSCYSRLRNTRRFGIIVFDRVRQNLLALIEEDNSLMREPLVIYAAALVCYMGLWCGNKRAFELSEALRAVIVTYIRRLPESNRHHEFGLYNVLSNDTNRCESSATRSKPKSSADSQWRDWIAHESRKRLRWFVYMIDAQFPSILGMSSMLTTADVRQWECPCDESFWALPAARSWKHRLGSASEPACSVFGSLIALIFTTRTSPTPSTIDVLLPSVNAWSASLLLSAVMCDVFHYQDTLVVLRTYQEEIASSVDALHQDARALDLLAMLEAWNSSYQQRQVLRLDSTSARSHHCSTIMHYLARIYLVFPVSDIQDCLGKSGSTGSTAAMSRLSSWIAQHPKQASRCAEDAAACISIVISNTGESDPYDIIGLFLCHVVVWSFAHAASPNHKKQIVELLRNNQDISRSVLEVVEAGFAVNENGATDFEAPQLIFRHAIQSLAQMGDWGASSNLALLLHLHPGSSVIPSG